MYDPHQCEKCQSIFRSILRMQSAWSSMVSQEDATDFIREVMETERCDEFSDLSSLREGVVDMITPEGVDRIRQYKCTPQDEKRARYAMRYYDYDVKKQVVKSLSWSNWLRYNIIDRYDRLVGFNGFLNTTCYKTKYGVRSE